MVTSDLKLVLLRNFNLVSLVSHWIIIVDRFLSKRDFFKVQKNVTYGEELL